VKTLSRWFVKMLFNHSHLRFSPLLFLNWLQYWWWCIFYGLGGRIWLHCCANIIKGISGITPNFTLDNKRVGDSYIQCTPPVLGICSGTLSSLASTYYYYIYYYFLPFFFILLRIRLPFTLARGILNMSYLISIRHQHNEWYQRNTLL
jgi:hypothetical protein